MRFTHDGRAGHPRGRDGYRAHEPWSDDAPGPARTVYTRTYDTGRRERGAPVTVSSTTYDTGRRKRS